MENLAVVSTQQSPAPVPAAISPVTLEAFAPEFRQITDKPVYNAPLALVRSIPEPPATETWAPLSHARLLDNLEWGLDHIGVRVVSRTYDLTKAGSKLFGTYVLDQATKNTAMQVGFRNSLDKSMAVGLVAGTHTFVCSNGMFTGDTVLFRKHTSGLTDKSLRELMLQALATLVEKLQATQEWHEGLRNEPLPVPACKRLAYDAVASGALPGSQLLKFNDMIFNPDSDIDLYTDGTVWAFHGACTDLMKGDSGFAVQRKNVALERIVNNYLQTRPTQVVV